MEQITEYVVHADDFGYSASVNACIDGCFCQGWLSETSLMVNMPGCDEAVAMARKGGYISRVGLHLNLTEGIPLTELIRSCSRFCSGNKFNKEFHCSSLKRFFLSPRERKAVKMEIVAQIEKFMSYEGVMMKLDSHHHAHTDLAVYMVLKPIAIRAGFKTVRISADLHRVSWLKSMYKKFYNAEVRRHFSAADHFDGIVDGLLDQPGGVTEVMVHPLIFNGILCDSRKPFTDNINRVIAVPNSSIRDWRN